MIEQKQKEEVRDQLLEVKLERERLESVMLQESSLLQNPMNKNKLYKSELSINQKVNALSLDDEYDDELLLEELNC